MMSKYINRIERVLLLSIVLLPMVCYAQSDIFLNPGIKLGYAFSESSGFIIGAELSLVIHSDHAFYGGALLSIDRLHDLTKMHAGVEFGAALAGISIGPTLLYRKDKNDLGLTVTPYVGALIIPYYSFTSSPKFGAINELGSYFKYPIFLKGQFPSLH